MKPYYSTPDGAIQIYHARWEDALAAGVFEPKDVALIHADPPYGVRERTDRASKGRGKRGILYDKKGRQKSSHGLHPARDWAPVVDDDRPFDPASLLALDRPLITWGANNYSSRLPDSPSWLEWDKRDEVDSDDNGDMELAWTNLGGPPRKFRHLWRGLCRASEKAGGKPSLHPTQKPEALSAWIFAHAMVRKKLKRGDLVLVPYMGSGPDLRPAQAAGLRVVACEVAEEYCRTAVSARLGAITTEAAREVPGPLFAR